MADGDPVLKELGKSVGLFKESAQVWYNKDVRKKVLDEVDKKNDILKLINMGNSGLEWLLNDLETKNFLDTKSAKALGLLIAGGAIAAGPYTQALMGLLVSAGAGTLGAQAVENMLGLIQQGIENRALERSAIIAGNPIEVTMDGRHWRLDSSVTTFKVNTARFFAPGPNGVAVPTSAGITLKQQAIASGDPALFLRKEAKQIVITELSGWIKNYKDKSNESPEFKDRHSKELEEIFTKNKRNPTGDGIALELAYNALVMQLLVGLEVDSAHNMLPEDLLAGDQGDMRFNLRLRKSLKEAVKLERDAALIPTRLKIDLSKADPQFTFDADLDMSDQAVYGGRSIAQWRAAIGLVRDNATGEWKYDEAVRQNLPKEVLEAFWADVWGGRPDIQVAPTGKWSGWGDYADISRDYQKEFRWAMMIAFFGALDPAKILLNKFVSGDKGVAAIRGAENELQYIKGQEQGLYDLEKIKPIAGNKTEAHELAGDDRKAYPDIAQAVKNITERNGVDLAEMKDLYVLLGVPEKEINSVSRNRMGSVSGFRFLYEKLTARVKVLNHITQPGVAEPNSDALKTINKAKAILAPAFKRVFVTKILLDYRADLGSNTPANLPTNEEIFSALIVGSDRLKPDFGFLRPAGQPVVPQDPDQVYRMLDALYTIGFSEEDGAKLSELTGYPKALLRLPFRITSTRSLWGEDAGVDETQPAKTLDQRAFRNSLINLIRDPLVSKNDVYLAMMAWIDNTGDPANKDRRLAEFRAVLHPFIQAGHVTTFDEQLDLLFSKVLNERETDWFGLALEIIVDKQALDTELTRRIRPLALEVEDIGLNQEAPQSEIEQLRTDIDNTFIGGNVAQDVFDQLMDRLEDIELNMQNTIQEIQALNNNPALDLATRLNGLNSENTQLGVIERAKETTADLAEVRRKQSQINSAVRQLRDRLLNFRNRVV
jgi:hypothetical protein